MYFNYFYLYFTLVFFLSFCPPIDIMAQLFALVRLSTTVVRLKQSFSKLYFFIPIKLFILHSIENPLVLLRILLSFRLLLLNFPSVLILHWPALATN